MSSGEEERWVILAGLEPEDVCKRAKTDFDSASGIYTFKSFGMDINVSPKEKKIFSSTPGSDVLLNRLRYFSHLAFLWYLVNAQDIPPSKQLVKPVNLKGGQLFFRGSHALPLDKIAEKYQNDAEGFIKKGRSFKCEELKYGDTALKLFPLPRVPVVLILWTTDDEFPARVDLLLDSTCEMHLPLDIIWSVAMESLLIML